MEEKGGKKQHIDKLDEEKNVKSIRLSEDDIPGASLNGKNRKQLSVKQLKFWLSCRGAKTSGRKDELVLRVQNYNDIPELRDKIIDPDPDKVFTKAKLEDDKLDNKISDAFLQKLTFPVIDDDFSDDLKILPTFNPGDLYSVVKNSGKNIDKYRHLPMVDKAVDKGFFMKNLVHDLQTCQKENNIVYVRALCWASMSKSLEYRVRLTVNPKAKEKVISAQCDQRCPAR